MNFRADIHCHTTCSDGVLTPQLIVELACDLGLAGLSITDHDVVEGYSEAQTFAAEKGLMLVPGIEYSTTFQKRNVHVLGYGFLPGHPEIKKCCEKNRSCRLRRNEQIFEKLRKNNVNLVKEDIEIFSDIFSKTCLGRTHIACLLKEKGIVNSLQRAFDKYLGDGKSCFVPVEYCSTQEVIDGIHEAGGYAILAHPHFLRRNRLVKNLLDLPFDGMECYYARLPKDQEKRWIEMATERKLIITGGSDFHGDIKAHIPLGCSWVPEETFMLFYNRFLKNQGLIQGKKV